MFRVTVSQYGFTLEELRTEIDDWAEQYIKWDDDPVEHDMREVSVDGSEVYHRGNFRFEQDDTKADLIQKLEDKLENKVDWYRIGYHACTHDESDAQPCSWEDSVEWTGAGVTIPDWVPTIEP